MPQHVQVDISSGLFDIMVFYDRDSQPVSPEGPTPVNVFATIVENLRDFAVACEKDGGVLLAGIGAEGRDQEVDLGTGPPSVAHASTPGKGLPDQFTGLRRPAFQELGDSCHRPSDRTRRLLGSSAFTICFL